GNGECGVQGEHCRRLAFNQLHAVRNTPTKKGRRFPGGPDLFQVRKPEGFRSGSDFVSGVFGRVLRFVRDVGGVFSDVGSIFGRVGGGVGHVVGSSGRRIGSGVGGAVSGVGGGVGGSLGGFLELAVGGVRLGLGLGSSVGGVSGRVGGGVLVRARGQGEAHGERQQSLVDGHGWIPRR